MQANEVPCIDDPLFEVITGDPRFKPDAPVIINGYRYLPAARVELIREALKEAIK